MSFIRSEYSPGSVFCGSGNGFGGPGGDCDGGSGKPLLLLKATTRPPKPLPGPPKPSLGRY